MLKFMVTFCVVCASVVAQAGEINVVATSATCDFHIPDWGSLEPRSQEWGRELRLAGGAWVSPKQEVETSFEFQWYPEEGPSDSLFVAVATNGELSNARPTSGLIFEIRSEGQVVGTVMHPNEDAITVTTPVGRIPAIQQIVRHIVRVERRVQDDVLECEVFLDDVAVAMLRGNLEKLRENKRIAIGNRAISRNEKNENIVPVSFISALQTVE